MEHADKILFVDDDAPVRSAFSRSLRGRGFTVDLASGIGEALAMASNNAYAVIASDYRMPNVDGLELIEQVRELQPDATYVLVSGECDLELALEAVNNHAVTYVVPKPWDIEELCSVLRRSIEAQWERAGQRAVQRFLVENSRRLEEQKRRLDEALVKNQALMAEALLSTLDLRNHETRAHCQRASTYARMLAEKLGLRGSILTSVQYGALLHDIGKIGVPDSILLKPGPLNAEEWKLMRTHTTMGAHLLDELEGLVAARDIVLQHHERWDGNGYPAGLAGEEICIGARIFAVVDALDAILSDRPYRKASTIDVARSEIQRGAGTQFDPSVVRAFLQIPAEQWVQVRKQFPDRPSSREVTREPRAA